MSAWLLDLGNTRLKCAPLLGAGGVGECVALPHRPDELEPRALATAVARLLPERLDVAYLASVATPALTAALVEQLEPRCDRISRARTLPALAGVRIAYADPDRLGVDRFLAMLAAHAATPGAAVPALVCGVGTALTIDLLAADGRHVGGRIAPSPTLMREALHAHVAQLPVGGGRYREFADDTDDALASGCNGAALALIGQSIDAARRRLHATPAVMLHGGGAQALLPQLADARWAPTLVLDGLAIWAGADIGTDAGP